MFTSARNKPQTAPITKVTAGDPLPPFGEIPCPDSLLTYYLVKEENQWCTWCPNHQVDGLYMCIGMARDRHCPHKIEINPLMSAKQKFPIEVNLCTLKNKCVLILSFMKMVHSKEKHRIHISQSSNKLYLLKDILSNTLSKKISSSTLLSVF
jgi:hypothetical protein